MSSQRALLLLLVVAIASFLLFWQVLDNSVVMSLVLGLGLAAMGFAGGAYAARRPRG